MFAGNTVYVRGGMNGWGEVDAFTYQGASVYTADIAIATGEYEFKIATGDWSTVDFGAIAGDEVVLEGSNKPLAKKGANMKLSVAADATYRFTVTGPSSDSPTLKVMKLN
jgi:pullulanase